MADCVLFDLEGTLVDFQWKLEEAEADLRAALAPLGFDPELFRADNYAGILRRALSLAASPPVREMVDQALAPVYDRYDLDAESRWSLRDGARDLLAGLAARGLAVALVTNIGRLAATRALERHGITGAFRLIATRDDVEHMKPSGEGIRKVLSALGCDPARALMVGDSLSDVLAARDAGVPVAVVAGGETLFRGLEGERPDFTVASLHQIAPLLDGP